jgi:hypothetical protein
MSPIATGVSFADRYSEDHCRGRSRFDRSYGGDDEVRSSNIPTTAVWRRLDSEYLNF